MSEKKKLIPADARLAARRGFIRTTSQALATTIPTSGITGAVLSDADWRVVMWAVVAAILSSVGAGAVSYFSILSAGIPEDYTPAAARPPVDDGYVGRHRKEDGRVAARTAIGALAVVIVVGAVVGYVSGV